MLMIDDDGVKDVSLKLKEVEVKVKKYIRLFRLGVTIIYGAEWCQNIMAG